MGSLRVGFIGFGEAAYHISDGLTSEGIENICAYDVNANDRKLGQTIKKRAESSNVKLVTTIDELFQNTDIVFCATSAKYAFDIAKTSAPYLSKNQLYVDLNAASPKVKKEIDSTLKNTGAHFIDAAVMDAVPPNRHKVPILVSGPESRSFEALVKPLGMNITVVDSKPGTSSAIKMFRSVFMKGFTMLLLETLSASYEYGVETEIMSSIEQTLGNNDLEKLTNLLITRSVTHAERRVAEMEEVIETLQEINVDSSMSTATRAKLKLLVDMELNHHFDYKTPQHYKNVLEVMNQTQ